MLAGSICGLSLSLSLCLTHSLSPLLPTLTVVYSSPLKEGVSFDEFDAHTLLGVVLSCLRLISQTKSALAAAASARGKAAADVLASVSDIPERFPAEMSGKFRVANRIVEAIDVV